MSGSISSVVPAGDAAPLRCACDALHCALAAASPSTSRPLGAEPEKTMFSLLVGLGALLLAVFVSAILDPRPSRSGGADERARADDGYDHLINGTLQPGVA